MRWLEADGGRSFLRALPVLAGSAPPFDIGSAPAEPLPLFIEWIEQAAQAGVPEPQAMTISTVDALGAPRARVLILKAIDQDGWHFAASSASQKGRDLSAHPAAALTFHWPAVVRQVRVVGTVVDDGAQASAADFLGRPIGSRAMALTLRQSRRWWIRRKSTPRSRRPTGSWPTTPNWCRTSGSRMRCGRRRSSFGRAPPIASISVSVISGLEMNGSAPNSGRSPGRVAEGFALILLSSKVRTVSASPTYKIWQRLQNKPGGSALFSAAMMARVPYFASVVPHVHRMEPGYCEVTAPKWYFVYNHIKTFHAIAACNLAEVAMGMLMEATTPSSHRWIPKAMNVQYLGKATTSLRAIATLEGIDFASITEGTDVVVPISITDRDGKEVVKAEITTWVTPA
ncbi:Pyridoxamine 5'-phosphate oxidase [Mycobacteroides abscessus]|nr:Pyridoxamine 5'-phosphate oxidase [Mycobacteroides abscessus]